MKKHNLLGVEVHVDPNAPKGMVYMINNDDWSHSSCDCQVIIFSRWQRLKLRIKRLVRRLANLTNQRKEKK